MGLTYTFQRSSDPFVNSKPCAGFRIADAGLSTGTHPRAGRRVIRRASDSRRKQTLIDFIPPTDQL
jgi:hypothetical protein